MRFDKCGTFIRYRPVFGCQCALCERARQVIRDRQMRWLVKVSIAGIGVALALAGVRWL